MSRKDQKTITISFMNNEEENKLYDDVIEGSKYIGYSKWGKMAFREKLERDRNNQPANNQQFQMPDINNSYPTMQNTDSSIINSMDELMP